MGTDAIEEPGTKKLPIWFWILVLDPCPPNTIYPFLSCSWFQLSKAQVHVFRLFRMPIRSSVVWLWPCRFSLGLHSNGRVANCKDTPRLQLFNIFLGLGSNDRTAAKLRGFPVFRASTSETGRWFPRVMKQEVTIHSSQAMTTRCLLKCWLKG